MRRSNAVSAPSGQSSRRRVAGRAASSRPLWRQRRGEAAARAPLASAPPTLRSRLPAPEASRRAVPGAGSGCHARGGEGLVAVLGVPQQLGEHPQTGDAVREAVVDADHERGAAIGEWAGDAYRPEWSRVIEALGHRRSDQPHQLGSVAHLAGQRDARGFGCRTPSRRPRPGRRAARGSPPGAAGRVARPPAAPRLGRARARPSAARRPAPPRRSPASGCGRLWRRIRAAGSGCRRRSVAPSDSSLPDGVAHGPQIPPGRHLRQAVTGSHGYAPRRAAADSRTSTVMTFYVL